MLLLPRFFPSMGLNSEPGDDERDVLLSIYISYYNNDEITNEISHIIGACYMRSPSINPKISVSMVFVAV